MTLKKEIIKFSFTGVLSTCINYIIYISLFKLSSNIIMSSAIGYSAGILNSYIFGKRWVFNYLQRSNFTSPLKFLLIYLIGGCGMTLIIYLLSNNGIEYRIAWGIGSIYAVINNFFGSKYFVFRK